jgi:hypothetical protein
MQIDITSDVAETLEGFASFLERVRIQETRAHWRSAAGRYGIRRLHMANSWIDRNAGTPQPTGCKSFLGYLPDAEVVDPLAGLQFRSEPTRGLPSSRPSLGRPIRIPKLRNDGWIWTLPGRRILALGFDTTLELLKAIFEYALLRKQRGCKPGCDFLVQCPQLIRGHRFEVIPVHDRPQLYDSTQLSSLAENMSRIRPIRYLLKYLFQTVKVPTV